LVRAAPGAAIEHNAAINSALGGKVCFSRFMDWLPEEPDADAASSSREPLTHAPCHDPSRARSGENAEKMSF
jgi:hypothetical protein